MTGYEMTRGRNDRDEMTGDKIKMGTNRRVTLIVGLAGTGD
jgi:hypothetical protein